MNPANSLSIGAIFKIMAPKMQEHMNKTTNQAYSRASDFTFNLFAVSLISVT